MRYSLMHKNIVVADIEIDEAICMITQVNSVYAKEHMPLGVVRNEYGRETIDRDALNQWWANRCIPSKRRQFREQALSWQELCRAERLPGRSC